MANLKQLKDDNDDFFEHQYLNTVNVCSGSINTFGSKTLSTLVNINGWKLTLV